MGRANNERPSCSSKAQQIFRSVIGIHHKSFNILILTSKSCLSQVFVLDIGGSMLGYLNSHLPRYNKYTGPWSKLRKIFQSIVIAV